MAGLIFLLQTLQENPQLCRKGAEKPQSTRSRGEVSPHTRQEDSARDQTGAEPLASTSWGAAWCVWEPNQCWDSPW